MNASSLNNKNPCNQNMDQGYGKSKAQKKMVPKVISKDCWPYLYWVGLWAFVKVNKHLWSNSPICEALPSPVWLFVQHMVIVRIPFPYPKCHSVELVVTLWPSLLNFSPHPSLANWLQLWSEYGLESLVWVIANKWNPLYVVNRSPVKWLLLVISVIWMICRACLDLWTLAADGC